MFKFEHVDGTRILIEMAARYSDIVSEAVYTSGARYRVPVFIWTILRDIMISNATGPRQKVFSIDLILFKLAKRLRVIMW